ncbi:hypothetical protein, partial [Roseiconus lacunae]|uniref:hypothetical protein n=1 Tax=Roseiconus lacunae TaxID=2605694 RepID=UPI001E36AA32
EHGTKPLIIDEPLAILEIAKNSGPHHRASDGIANVGDNGVAAKHHELRKQQRPRLPFITWFVRLRLPPAGSWTGQNHCSNRCVVMGLIVKWDYDVKP